MRLLYGSITLQRGDYLLTPGATFWRVSPGSLGAPSRVGSETIWITFEAEDTPQGAGANAGTLRASVMSFRRTSSQVYGR